MNEKEKGRRGESRSKRIEGLRRRGEFERETLVREITGLRESMDAKRARWKMVAWIAGIAASMWTVGTKLFGKHSLSAQLGRITSAAQLVFGLGRAVSKVRKFW